jgi:hypothetical protein
MRQVKNRVTSITVYVTTTILVVASGYLSRHKFTTRLLRGLHPLVPDDLNSKSDLPTSS